VLLAVIVQKHRHLVHEVGEVIDAVGHAAILPA
jgi:hypothetical protein